MEEKEIIKNIEEVYDKKIEGEFFDGYCIETNKNKYYFLIENGQQCCENWGYIVLEDYNSIQDCIGLELRNIKYTTDNANETKIIDKIGGWGGDINDCMFIDIDCGDISNLNTIHFAIYNSHNGYYSHKVVYYRTSLDNNTCEIMQNTYYTYL